MLDGFVFDKRPITSKDWAHYNWILAKKKDGVTAGCTMSVSGNNISVADGYFFIRGRVGVVRGATVVNVPAVSSGQLYGVMVARIDLSQVNTEQSMNQLSFAIKTNQTAYPAATQQDLDGTGTIYEVIFAKFTVSANGIENFESVVPTDIIDWIGQSQIVFDNTNDNLHFVNMA